MNVLYFLIPLALLLLAGAVWAFFWARFRDPGDGSRHEAKVFAQLTYGGDAVPLTVTEFMALDPFSGELAGFTRPTGQAEGVQGAADLD